MGNARYIRLVGIVSAVVLAPACGGSPKDGIGPAGNGALVVQVTGLPAGTAARVSVTAPGGSVTNLTGSTVLTGLVAGDYGLTAGYVNAQNQTWSPQLSVSSVTVAESDTASVAVTYSGAPASTLDLRIAGAQLIQSTQRADGSVPMVAGRDALARIFLVANGANTATPAVRLRLFVGGNQVDSLTIPAQRTSVPTSVDTSSLSASWNVLIPGARVVNGMALQAVADPDDNVAETDESDNLWPGPAPQAVSVRPVPAFNLRFVPVKQSVNDLTGQVSNANKTALADLTARMHPLGSTAVSVRSTFVTDAPVLVSNDSNGAWSRILNETYALRNADGYQGNYVAIVPATYNSGIAGLGYIGAPAAVAWDKAASAPGVIAHELGHNFGRYHAPCGGPASPDPNYPYPNGSIGNWGLDLPAMTLKAPGTYKDLMSYCNPDWISDYNYVAVMDFRGSAADVARSDVTPAREGLLVWGRILDGTVFLEPSFRVTAPARLPARPGPQRIEGRDVSGRRVFSVSFEGEAVQDLEGREERHFAFVLPLTSAELTGIESLQLAGRGVTVRQQRARSEPATRRGQPTLTRRGEQLEIRWDPSYPLAVIRDASNGEIISFARRGLGRIPGTIGAVSVELSEGVSSQPGVSLRAP
jgi:hypothetical protein